MSWPVFPSPQQVLKTLPQEQGAGGREAGVWWETHWACVPLADHGAKWSFLQEHI